MNLKQFLILLFACLLLAVHAGRSGRNEGNFPRAVDAPQEDPEPTPAVRRHAMTQDAKLASLKRSRAWIVTGLVLSQSFIVSTDCAASIWPHVFTGCSHRLLALLHGILWIQIIIVVILGLIIELKIAIRSSL